MCHTQCVRLQELRHRGLNLVGFSFNGDNRLGRAFYDPVRDAASGAPAEALLRVNHSVVTLYAVPDRQMVIKCFCDWLHIVFRLRRRPGRRLDIGGMLIKLQPLQQMASKQQYWVSKSDIDFRFSKFANKQCFEGNKKHTMHTSCHALTPATVLAAMSLLSAYAQ